MPYIRQDGDVFSKQFFGRTPGQKTAAVLDGGESEISEDLAGQIEDGGGLEDHGVAAGRQFPGLPPSRGFAGGLEGQGADVERSRVTGGGFGPAGAVGTEG